VALSVLIIPEFAADLAARLAGFAAQVVLPSRSPFAVERRVRGLLWSFRLRASRLRIDRSVQVEYPRSIRLGRNVTVYAGCQLVGGPDAEIRIGDDTHLGRGTVISGLGGVEIGRGCAVSSHVSIYSQSNQYRVAPQQPILANPIGYAKVTIGDDVWIGAGAVILPGVTIGEHAIVGAGAAVSRDVPEWTIVAGVPARARGDRRSRPGTAPRGRAS